MAETVDVEVPQSAFGDDLAESLAHRGLHADVVTTGDACTLRVQFAADERERLLGAVTDGVERWLGEKMLPLVVERRGGACIVRPQAD